MAIDKEIRNSEVLSKIRQILEQRGLTQRDFAALLGKKESEVSRWLSGKFNISRQSQEKIEAALGEPVSADSTFRRTEGEIRFGIIGSGDMAGRFVREAQSVSGIRIVAAYNPVQMLQCELFCRTNAIDRCSPSLEELLAGVDAVYVASPVDTHYKYTRVALENGRHVICEMPFLQNKTEADELLRLAARRNLILLTALKTAYCPSFQQMIRVAQSGIIGDIADVSATVTNLLPEDTSAVFANERMMENFSYPLLTFFKLLGLKYRHFHSFVRMNGDKMLFANVMLEYDNAVGNFKVGVGVKSEGSLVVSGTRGYIYVPAPWWKPDYFEVRFENPADNKKYFFPYEAAGLRYEIQVFRDKVARTSPIEYISREEILHTIDIQKKIQQSIK